MSKLYKEPTITFNKKKMTINGRVFTRHPFENEKEEIFEVVEQYLNGMPIVQIEGIYNVPKTKFKSIRKALGLKIQHGGNHSRGEKLKKQTELHKSIAKDIGKISIKEIMLKYNKSESFVRKIKKSSEK